MCSRWRFRCREVFLPHSTTNNAPTVWPQGLLLIAWVVLRQRLRQHLSVNIRPQFSEARYWFVLYVRGQWLLLKFEITRVSKWSFREWHFISSCWGLCFGDPASCCSRMLTISFACSFQRHGSGVWVDGIVARPALMRDGATQLLYSQINVAIRLHIYYSACISTLISPKASRRSMDRQSPYFHTLHFSSRLPPFANFDTRSNIPRQS